MADTREDIMSRLVTLMRTVSGVDEVARNVLMSDDEEDNRRRITILEGDEMIDEEDQQRTRNRPADSPVIMHMQPLIELSNFASSADVGSELSIMRASVINKIATDNTLIGLTAKGRGGIYLGLASEIAFARKMAARLTMKFQFTYVLRPDQL